VLNPKVDLARGKGGASKDFVVHTNASRLLPQRDQRAVFINTTTLFCEYFATSTQKRVSERKGEREHTHTHTRAQKQTSHHNGKNDANVLVRPESNLLGVVLRRRVLTLLRDDGDIEQALDHEHEFSLGDIRVEFRFVVRMVRFLRDGVVEADDFGA
jgi:hypothetical protein